ncbi:acetyl-CoA hydrolase/transferase family protein [Advenella mimigardefordensis]|uniref:Putative acetyl-CoA hydrolase/transferase n=1 Tax=Advenella mimigardefordensis (strain DSM 17166 / LMG 22922 / DPN7) TaxID=1247726 RepID=W0PDD1_ADVMD|nr:acetyl-CoA hydrolase/transferase C-terminal domain-containing protein [Advenella mimigardefordensis]AHG63472.1 putative acetyl-CoA hydrolase/transferase [Advenella mimigardefordensis DPN7]
MSQEIRSVTSMQSPSQLLAQLRFADYIQPGDVIGWPQGPGEPLALTQKLVEQRAALPPCALLFGLSVSNTLQPELSAHFQFHALNGAGTARKVTASAAIFPSHVSTIPRLFRSGKLRIDIALIQVVPVSAGKYSLGVIADFTQAMIDSARVVIAIINPALPRLGADALVDAADIDVLVEGDDRILDMPDAQPSDVERQVARQVAALIPDRATVQLGVGTLPTAVAEALVDHRELGVHSGVVSDVLVSLVEKGVVSNAHKGLDAGLTVTGGLFGTQRLREFAAQHNLVSLRCADYTHSLATASALQCFHTVNSAIEIDLTGQVNAEVAGGRYLGALGGHADFVRAGTLSPGGRSIIAIPSATADGKHSRLVASLGMRPVTTSRGDVDIVVTEYGVAHLQGCSLNERIRQLIAIAHPDHRETLEKQAQDIKKAQGFQ